MVSFKLRTLTYNEEMVKSWGHYKDINNLTVLSLLRRFQFKISIACLAHAYVFVHSAQKYGSFVQQKLYQPTMKNTHIKTNLNCRLLDNTSELLVLLSVKWKVD
jgi:hypothetical protein